LKKNKNPFYFVFRLKLRDLGSSKAKYFLLFKTVWIFELNLIWLMYLKNENLANSSCKLFIFDICHRM